VISYNI